MTNGHGRCPTCGRILALVNNRLPPHRVPQQKTNPNGGVPLTGKDAKWCKGIG